MSEHYFSKSDFSDNLVPKLKHSLTLALDRYFPLAGNLIYPSDKAENKPVIRYAAGDYVPLAIFESAQPRDADEVYKYIPQLPAIVPDESGQKLLKVLSLQVTLFPGRGKCIGIANHHSVGDASSIVGFIRAWASICTLGRAEESREYSVPVLERGLIKDPLGFDSFIWDQVKQIPFNLSPFPLPTKRFRATYILNQARIKKLKDMISAEFLGTVHPSSFVVTSAHVWTCVAKCLEDERVDHDEVECFAFVADMRARIDPPLPETYFGNCLLAGITRAAMASSLDPAGFSWRLGP